MWGDASARRDGVRADRLAANDARGPEGVGLPGSLYVASDQTKESNPDDRARRVGLCFHCRHARVVPSRHAEYWMCRLSLVDPRFPKYPRLPVLACDGYEPGEREEASDTGAPRED
jgi:hypothetical protein